MPVLDQGSQVFEAGARSDGEGAAVEGAAGIAERQRRGADGERADKNVRFVDVFGQVIDEEVVKSEEVREPVDVFIRCSIAVGVKGDDGIFERAAVRGRGFVAERQVYRRGV